MQENYSIVSLNGPDIGKLLKKSQPESRMISLRGMIMDSDEEARRGRARLPKRWSGNDR